jgi:hypothetical protein
MYRFRQLPIILALFATILAAAAGSAGDTATQARIRAATERGLDWIERHPASVQDGGLSDVLDEGVGFRVMSTLAGDPTAREHFAARFRERMAALGALPEFVQWANSGQKGLTDYYYLVLAAHLMQQAGTPSDQQTVIVAQAQWVLAATPRCDPTKRLTIALFLERLDEEPVISIPAALSASRIERIARGSPPVLPAASADPQQRLAASLYLYALVHEIVALTDFGREPAPPWLAERLEPLQRFLVTAVAWAGEDGNVDLLSELLLTARFIDAPLQALSPDILQQLLSGQQADGSWGAYQTNRPNKRRHAVFTATAALLSYTGSVTE